MSQKAQESERRITPARLSFFAIYNPAIGPTDDTFRQQIVYWHSRITQSKGSASTRTSRNASTRRENENEKLRQIGLAQGMVGFAKSFAAGRSAEFIDTEKSRILIHELEEGWKPGPADRKQSIDLTRIPSLPSSKDSRSDHGIADAIEYSARDISQPTVLRTQLAQAHRIFLLHHGATLEDVFARCTRSRFCGLLGRFWDGFLSEWDVISHGNPSECVYDGLKLSAGGELGVGVGEEDWGSGERDVLEGFASRTEGLVDMVVARYGHEQSKTRTAQSDTLASDQPVKSESSAWLGAGNQPEATDGVIFSGTGALARSSVRDIANWMQQIYVQGGHAYGVKDSPSSTRNRRHNSKTATVRPTSSRRTQVSASREERTPQSATPSLSALSGIPRPIVSAAETSLQQATDAAEKKRLPASIAHASEESDGWMKFLTLGYGSSWGPSGTGQVQKQNEEQDPIAKGVERVRRSEPTLQHLDPTPESEALYDVLQAEAQQDDGGQFLIGLTGPLDELTDKADCADDRIVLRTLHVELISDVKHTTTFETESNCSTPSEKSQSQTATSERRACKTGKVRRNMKRLRVIVYVQRPFVYTLLFLPRTEMLQLPSFYRNLFDYFSPLQSSLTASTNPDRVASRIAAAGLLYPTGWSPPLRSAGISQRGAAKSLEPIYHLLFDSKTLNVHSNLPPIPLPQLLSIDEAMTSGGSSVWGRAEALSVHSAIVENVSRSECCEEIERSIKTGRGWWVVWMRIHSRDQQQTAQSSHVQSEVAALPDKRAPGNEQNVLHGDNGSTPSSSSNGAAQTMDGDTAAYFHDKDSAGVSEPVNYKEAILIRQSRDTAQAKERAGTTIRSSLWGFGNSVAGKDPTAGWGSTRLAEGVGVDARKYVEGLMGLGR